MSEKIVIYDCGSQYTMLIARRIREKEVFSLIVPNDFPPEDLPEKPAGFIISGGPRSVYEKGAPSVPARIFDMGVPVLGICYGHQLIAKIFSGKIEKAKRREYGIAHFNLIRESPLFYGTKKRMRVWMSHADEVIALPEGFLVTGETESCSCASMENPKKKIYGLQFHPEVSHTEEGEKILENYLRKVCKIKGRWKLTDFISEEREKIRKMKERGGILLALSGGVDSSVLSKLIADVAPDSLFPIFVDTGLLKEGEKERIRRVFGNLKNLIIYDAEERFYRELKGITDPEEKRRVIGRLFGEIFVEVYERIGKKIKYLAQGTLYPDVIESGRGRGPAETIKSHHNVAGLPGFLKLELYEPFKNFFKDEIREMGRILGLPEEIIKRHPFPGPGLAIRVVGEVTKEKVEILRKADRIVEQEVKKAGIYDSLWQVFPILLPIKSVGVMGDRRTYAYSIALRAVESLDGMTADWAKIPPSVLEKISSRIIGEVQGVNRVLYDITSKPPATIEWE